ncbi:hypothetical protein GCM10027612_87020 [Microbispora bryophytorum subsp. camponoti]
MVWRSEAVGKLKETVGSFALVDEEHGQILRDGLFRGIRHGAFLGITASVQPPEEIVHGDLFIEGLYYGPAECVLKPLLSVEEIAVVINHGDYCRGSRGGLVAVVVRGASVRRRGTLGRSH